MTPPEAAPGVGSPADRLLVRARAWIAGDPDPVTAAQLRALVDSGDLEALGEVAGADLAFGTAGLRGEVAAGPNRMNRAVVIRATRGLVDHLDATGTQGPVIVGFDARTDSERFAEDAAGVLLAAGREVHYFAVPTPTPIVAFAAAHLRAAAAIVVTASHNPPRDNGYKVYASNAAQIVSPTDSDIANAIAVVGAASEVPRVDAAFAAGSAAHVMGPDIQAAYEAAINAVRPDVTRAEVGLVYTPLHGVGWAPVRDILGRAGYHPAVVVEQAQPDGAFPTVAFPNPEEPGALDLAIAAAQAAGADAVIANDPDADRLAVALPRDGTFQTLTGNQVGVLLGDFALRHADVAGQALTLSSIVSSPMLASVAAAHAARYEATLTGFKWICNAALDLEAAGEGTFVFGYEEALGYAVGRAVRDKDGISAALVFCDLLASLKAEGRTPWDALEVLYAEHGRWLSLQRSVVLPGLDGVAQIAAAMERIGDALVPTSLGGLAVTSVEDYRTGAEGRPRWLPASDLVSLQLAGGSRALIRPSGTEPKLKVYVDLVDRSGDDAGTAEPRMGALGAEVAGELLAFVGLA